MLSEKQYLIDVFTVKDTWRLFRVLAELVDGFETLSEFSEGRELFINRHKAGLSYNIKGIPLTPVIEGEIFIPFTRKEPLFINEYRLWAGFEYAFNKRNSIGIKYGIQREINVSDPLTAYIVALKYSCDLN